MEEELIFLRRRLHFASKVEELVKGVVRGVADSGFDLLKGCVVEFAALIFSWNFALTEDSSLRASSRGMKSVVNTSSTSKPGFLADFLNAAVEVGREPDFDESVIE